ncbi:G:T/U-mismatch repair DNA glycosylase [Bradyrhizobium sp. USDA 4472]
MLISGNNPGEYKGDSQKYFGHNANSIRLEGC